MGPIIMVGDGYYIIRPVMHKVNTLHIHTCTIMHTHTREFAIPIKTNIVIYNIIIEVYYVVYARGQLVNRTEIRRLRLW